MYVKFGAALPLPHSFAAFTPQSQAAIASAANHGRQATVDGGLVL
jgi:hypothetical protein